MQYDVSSHPSSCLVVHLAGDLDLARNDELESVVSRFERSHCPDARVDVSDVRFIDSTGLTALVRLQQVATQRGGSVCLVGPRHQLERVLHVTGLDPYFQVLGATA